MTKTRSSFFACAEGVETHYVLFSRVQGGPPRVPAFFSIVRRGNESLHVQAQVSTCPSDLLFRILQDRSSYDFDESSFLRHVKTDAGAPSYHLPHDR